MISNATGRYSLPATELFLTAYLTGPLAVPENNGRRCPFLPPREEPNVSNANCWVCPLLVSLVSFYVTGSASAEDKTKFVIVTEGKQLGIKEGDTFYPLGMARHEFEKKFGPPDRKYDKYSCYLGDGLEVTYENGVVRTFHFYVKSNASPLVRDNFHAADVRTDKSKLRRATYRELARAHGNPQGTREIEGLNITYYNYTWGTITMEDGEISSISLFTDHR